MSKDPFDSQLTTVRQVEIPKELDSAARERFIQTIRDAVAMQARLASGCSAILPMAEDVELAGKSLLIEHSPATPIRFEQVLNAETRLTIEDLWSITHVGLRALEAAATIPTVHTGLHTGSLFRDRTGRVCISDFGIASAFEAHCGVETRRFVHCETVAREIKGGRFRSGVWRLLTDESRQENGWVATNFPPELLDDATRFNVKADQFALGAMLYVLAAGVHPFGVEFDDPTVTFFLTFEPYALNEERRDWEETFERHDSGTATSHDRSIVAWGELVFRLLSTEPGERFTKISEALEEARLFVPETWQEADAALAEAADQLDQGDIGAFLETTKPWIENAGLPALWRRGLKSTVSDLSERREAIETRARRERMLADAQAALAAGETAQARTFAEQLLAEEQADDDQVSAARALIQECDAHKSLLEAGAAALAESYLSNARTALDAGNETEAEESLAALLAEPDLSPAMRTQAETLASEIEQRKEARQRALARLSSARAALQTGDLDQAAELLSSLEHEELTSEMQEQVATVAQSLTSTREAHDRYDAALARARDAWAEADEQTLERALKEVPEEGVPSKLRVERAAIAEKAGALKEALMAVRRAERALGSGNASEAADHLGGLSTDALPPAVVEQRTLLSEQIEAALAEVRKQAVENAIRTIEQATTALVEGDLGRCRTLCESVLAVADEITGEPQTEARAILDRCEAARGERERLLRATAALDDDRLDSAAEELDKIVPDAMVANDREKHAALLARIDAARAERSAREAAEITARLEAAEQAIESGEFDEAERNATTVASAASAPEEQRQRAAALQKRIDDERPIAETLAAAEAALGEDVSLAARLLEKGGTWQDRKVRALPESLPVWARSTAEAVRDAIQSRETELRNQNVAKARSALEAARQALDSEQVADTKEHLAVADDGVRYDDALQTEHASISEAVARLEKWLPKLEQWERRVEREPLAVVQEIEADPTDEAPPESVRKRREALAKRCRAQIDAGRQELSAALRTLEEELEQSGRRTKRFAARVGAIEQNALAADEHRTSAQALRDRFDSLPPLPTSKLPLAVAAVVGVVAIGGGVWFLIPGGGNDPTPPEPNGNESVFVDANANENETEFVVGNDNSDTSVARGNESVENTNADLATNDGNANEAVVVDGSNENTDEPIVVFDFEQVLRETPPPIAVNALPDLAGLLTDESPGLGSVVSELLSRVSDERVTSFTDDWKSMDDDTARAVRTATYRVADLALEGRVLAEYDEGASAWREDVQFELTSDAWSALATWIATRGRESAEEQSNIGELAAARRLWSTAVDEIEGLAQRGRASTDTLTEPDLPRAWEPPAGVAVVAQDERTGYPARLRLPSGRTLTLVAVPPTDAAWAVLPETARGWSVFYIDDAEWPEPVETMDQARTVLSGIGLVVPALREWQLGVLVQGDALQGAVGGAFEWCIRDGQAGWVTGGCSKIPNAEGVLLPPAPAPSADAADWVQWLASPLVTQERDFGDGLATVRGVLRVHPS